MELNFRLFNCDRTFSLDKVEALITKVSPKAKVKQQYFALPRMSELCNELNEEGRFSGYAVFVVHAHESRLSLNEENAGIGYARLYRTLLKITDGRVLIVIGGDNSYKGNEQEDAFLSKWAWRKICSQFTEDFMDGTNSFIFSWEENHRTIHEEALAFYLNPNKTRQKFAPKSKPKLKPPGASRDVPKPTAQQPCPSQAHTSLPLDFKSNLNPSSSYQFPPENNEGRVLPPEPHTKPEPSNANKETAKPESPMIDEPPNSKSAPSDALPMVHVVSILSGRDDVLENPDVLNLLANAFQSLDIPCVPYVPNVKPEDLPRHVRESRPDFVVLVSDYEDFNDVQNLKGKSQLFETLLKSVRNEERTKIILVVTDDDLYKKGDLSSKIVENKVNNLNGGILKQDKLTILSWNDSPSTIHQDTITKLLRDYKSAKLHPQRMQVYVTSENDVEKGHLRYRAIIQGGRVLAVLKSDPYGWSPKRECLSEPLAKHRERTEVELWENHGNIIISVDNATRMLRKMVDVVGPMQPSLQVYSYHSLKKTFNTVITFIKGLDIDFVPLKDPVEAAGLFQNIATKNPEYVAFSSDIEVFQEFQSVQELVKRHWLSASAIIANLKGIIIMLTGDQNYPEDGHAAVSEEVLKTVRQMTADIPINQEKITVMSWKTRPFICHQNKMKSLLQKSNYLQEAREPAKGTSKYPRDPRGHHGHGEPAKGASTCTPDPPGYRSEPAKGTSTHPREPRGYYGHDETTKGLPKETEFDETKGYLRFRAELLHGQLGKVFVRSPPDWKPDRRDMDFLFERYNNEPKATLEFWADSYDQPTKPPVVKIEKTGWFSKPSWLCSGKKTL